MREKLISVSTNPVSPWRRGKTTQFFVWKWNLRELHGFWSLGFVQQVTGWRGINTPLAGLFSEEGLNIHSNPRCKFQYLQTYFCQIGGGKTMQFLEVARVSGCLERGVRAAGDRSAGNKLSSCRTHAGPEARLGVHKNCQAKHTEGVWGGQHPGGRN